MKLQERESHLAELTDALAKASREGGHIALVSGEAGIGKTSLVDRFVRRQSQAVRVFWGACDALFTPRPLGPLYDMASQMGGDLPKLLSTETPRTAVFSAVLGELQSRPSIVIFEDVHWADEATLDLLRFLARRIQLTSTLMVLTYRDDELGPRHPLRMLLGELASSAVIRRIPLAPLSESAVRRLVGEQMVDVGQLYRQTEGNPFYVTEVLANPGGGIPINVREAVLARAARLSGAGYAVLEAAAIIGRRVAPWLLTAVAGEQAHAAEECMAVGMLVAQEDELAFRHDLAHSTILEAISLPRKQALHRLVLDALKSTPVGRSNLARLAHHAEGAGDREAVLVFAPNAARIASENDAHRAAAALYSLALRYAEDLPPGERAQLLEQHGRACEFIQEQPEAIDSYRTAAELWHQDGNRLKYGYLLSRQASVLSMAGDRDEAGEIIDRAIAVLESLPRGPELAYAYRNKALHHTYLGENPQAIAMADKTLALAKQLGDAYLSILAREAVGMCWLAVDHARGLEYLEETLSLALDNQIEGRVGALYGNMSMAYVDVYHFDRAERLIAEGIAYATERDLDTVRFFMRTWQAIAHFYQGRWDKASEGIDEVLRRPGLASISRIPALAVLGRLRARRGDPGSEDALDEALKIATWRRNFQRSGVVRTARAEAAWLAGQHEGTLEEARAAYDMTLNNKQAGFAAELAFWQWRAGEPVETYDWMLQAYTLHIAGDWQAAAEEWAHLGCPYEQARALADGDTSAQLKALEIFERLGARTDSENLRDKLRAADAVGIPQQPRAATLENPFHLTNRQVEVLKLLIEGLSNAEIAARLHISPKTAEHHVSAVLAKLNVSSRKDAAELGKSSKAF